LTVGACVFPLPRLMKYRTLRITRPWPEAATNLKATMKLGLQELHRNYYERQASIWRARLSWE
jgi:hypothetical protein